MGFTMHFYIIFGTNLSTRGPVLVAVFFCLFQCFAEKEYQTESKWNETFARIFLGTNATQETWSGSQRRNQAATRQGGVPRAGRPAPHSRGPLVAPLTYLRLYILLNPGNIQGGHETTFPPPQPYVPVSSHLGAFPTICRRGIRSRRSSTSTP